MWEGEEKLPRGPSPTPESTEDYISDEKVERVPGGYTLIFKFVRFDGVRRQLHKFV